MLFLAHWARKLSWQETAIAFRTSWDKVCQAVEYVVARGLEHRELGVIAAIGVDEIQYAKGHKYLTLVYQIEPALTRLLWIGKDRTVASFEAFFDMIGKPTADGIQFVCSDMWKPYLRVIRERAVNAVNTMGEAARLQRTPCRRTLLHQGATRTSSADRKQGSWRQSGAE
jgi:transposase